MTRLLFFFSVIALFSCNSNTKPATESAEKAETTVNFKTLSAPVPFSGHWISAAYLEQITTQQSPRKAQEGSEDVFIKLPENTLKTATMIYNFHEAIGDLVMVNRNGTFELWEKQNDTLSKSIYTIEKIAEDTLKIGGKIFVKINPAISGDQPLILETILFAGKYKHKQGGEVEFKSNGEVTGLGTYKYYSPVIDYFDAGLQVDQVGLGETPEKMEYFGFKFQNDNLDLFKLKCKEADPADGRCVDVAFGPKVYVLKKQI